jgi:hypothetical protein
MEKNIDANLDLAKSLKDFEDQVTNLLELTNVREWDGRVLKEREQKIRDERAYFSGSMYSLIFI